MDESSEHEHGENPSIGSASGDGIDKPSQAEGEDTGETIPGEPTSGEAGPGDKPSQADG